MGRQAIREKQSGLTGTALVRTRMPGGVGGRRGQPRLLPDVCQAWRAVHIPAWLNVVFNRVIWR